MRIVFLVFFAIVASAVPSKHVSFPVPADPTDGFQILEASASGQHEFDKAHPILQFIEDADPLVNDEEIFSWFLYLRFASITWAVWVILVLLVWKCCLSDDISIIKPPLAREDPWKIFAEQPFGCCRSPKIFLCTLCCPALVWANTMHLAQYMEVGMALMLFLGCVLLNGFTYGFIMYGSFTACLMIWYRHRLRKDLGPDPYTAKMFILDILCVVCCPFCAISQEARVVQNAQPYAILSSKA